MYRSYKCILEVDDGKGRKMEGPPSLALAPDARKLTVLFLVRLIPGKFTRRGWG